MKIYDLLDTGEDEFIKEIYEDGIQSLSKFFGFTIKPVMIFVKDRKTINRLKNQETEDWVVGWVEGNRIFMLHRDSYETETSNTYNSKYYGATLKHEIVHVFHRNLSKNKMPLWLTEGIAIYLSGQVDMKEPVDTLKEFLDIEKYDQGNIYKESGFVIKKLIDKFGKEKLIELIKFTSVMKSKVEFLDKFKKIYGSELSYDWINSL